MSFRTFGYFGPLCPLPVPQAGPYSPPNVLNNMRMYNILSGERIDEFPLDVAMKIFWEAETISINGFITAEYTTPQGGRAVGTLSGGTSVQWGEVNEVSPFPFTPYRPPMASAKEMLCTIQKAGNLGIHTFHSTLSSISPRMAIEIRRRDFGDGQISYAPFSINFEGAYTTSQGVQIFVLPFTNAGRVPVGNANWITPWGNVSTPLFFSPFYGNETHIASEMTITVTAANPTTRYA